MSYVITGGIGLAVGLGLMVWCLIERSKRHRAERAADKARTERDGFKNVAEHNLKRAGELEEQAERLNGQINAQRAQLEETRDRLVACNDPETIKDWLDKELEEGEL